MNLKRVGLMLCLLLMFGVTVPMRAQNQTPLPISLSDGELAEGSLSADEVLIYTILLPRGQDVWVRIESNAVIGLDYCLNYTVSNGSGGGACTSPEREDSRPVSLGYLFTSANRPDREETVQFTLRGPAQSEASFTITAYIVTPQPILLSQRGSAQANRVVHIYTLEADDLDVFTVQVEDPQSDGAFLWAAHQYYALPVGTQRSDARLDLPQWIDGASAPANLGGITRLDLFYAGARTYRIVVEAAASYSLSVNSVRALPLEIGQSMGIPVSWRQPVFYVPLAIPSTYGRDERITLDVELLEGRSAIINLWSAGFTYSSDRLTLGEALGSVDLIRAGSLTRPVGIGLFVTVSIPPEFTRSGVQVLIRWERADSS